MDASDSSLLREFVKGPGDRPFRQLVERYQDLVYSTALRRMGDRGRAEEVAQDVFVFVSEQARLLIRHPNLAGWLYKTTLKEAANMDAKAYPAQELLELYALRWEHEIFYKELKIPMRGRDVLQSHTPETAAQEVAALLMACAIIAEQRSEAARSGKLQPLSTSFVKTLEKMSTLWTMLEVSDGLVDEAGIQEMLRSVRALIVREATPPRRARSCPRKVRQPIGSWSRLTETQSKEGEFKVEVVKFP